MLVLQNRFNATKGESWLLDLSISLTRNDLNATDRPIYPLENGFPTVHSIGRWQDVDGESQMSGAVSIKRADEGFAARSPQQFEMSSLELHQERVQYSHLDSKSREPDLDNSSFTESAAPCRSHAAEHLQEPPPVVERP